MSNVLDGNAAAGALSEVFTTDATAAVTTCVTCGDQRPVGELRAFLGGPGMVLRCATCDAVQIRVATAGRRMWLDLQGVRVLQFSREP